MTKIVPQAGTGKVARTRKTGRSNVERTPNKRVSRYFNNNRPSGTIDNVKIDIQEPPKSRREKIKFQEADTRIKQLTDMLDENGALTEKERQWLDTLRNDHFDAFCRLGDLLHVPKYWRPSQHGVWNKQDRIKIRLQTLKAAVSEAVSTADEYDTDTQKKQAIDGALEKAAAVRKALNGKTGGKKLRVYQLVTKETLRHPQALYDKNNSMVMNTLLTQALNDPRKLNSGIENQDEVVEAAQALIANDLLDGPAAARLLSKLQDEPDEINALMAVNLHQQPDRQKVRSLLLLALARSPDDLVGAVSNTVHGGLSASQAPHPISEHLSTMLDIAADPENVVRPAHEWLPNLSPTGGTPEDVRNTWLAWAAGKVGNDSSPDVPHQDHGLDMRSFVLEEPGLVRVDHDIKADNIM